MNINVKQWPLLSIHGMSSRIDTNPDFQRPAVWTRPQKQLLIDTVLRNYDIPKAYLRKVGSKPDRYEVVDGQQRLRAIWEFFEGKYRLAKDADPVDDVSVAGLGYQDLPDDIRLRLDTYNLHVVVLEDADEDEVREMFLRLQNGTSLKAQERRNAMPGNMRNFVRATASHPFFNSCGFSNTRYAFDQVAAQIVAIELAGGPCTVTKSALDRMYLEHVDFDVTSREARKIQRVLDKLLEAFPEKTPELEKFSVLSLYLMTSILLDTYIFEDQAQSLHDWFIDFETDRRQRVTAEDEADRDPDMVVYQEKTSHATDAKDSLEWRHNYLMSLFLASQPALQLRDPRRDFTPQQRLAIYRRDGGHCQVQLACDGQRVRWDNWHCDHRVPHALGGYTTVDNGQVSCPTCNLKKGASSQAPPPSESIPQPELRDQA